MAMSNATRRQQGKMRELLWHFLEGQTCFFCGKPLLSAEDVERFHEIRFGNASAPPMDLNITIHHRNENHDDNRKQNRTLGHESCHKTHHAKKVFRAWRNGVVGSSGRAA